MLWIIKLMNLSVNKTIIKNASIALLFRVSVVLLMWLGGVGPAGWSDEENFYSQALLWSEYGISDILVEVINDKPGFWYSAFVSLLIKHLGFSLLAVRMLSAVVGVVAVILVYALAYDVSACRRAAGLASLIAAIFPSLIVFSSMATREPYIVVLILSATRCMLAFLRVGGFIYAFFYLACAAAASLFHGGVSIALVLLAGYIVFRGINKKRKWAGAFVLIALILFFLGYELSYVGSLKSLDGENIINEIGVRNAGNMAYPLVPNSLIEVAVYFPMLLFFFLVGAPLFPGMASMAIWVNSAFYACLLIYSIGKINSQHDLRRKALFFSFLIITSVFALGTQNYGTALRHKTKIAPLLIILAICPRGGERHPQGIMSKRSLHSDARFRARWSRLCLPPCFGSG